MERIPPTLTPLVIPLLTSTGNARDLAVVNRMVGEIRKRWPRAAERRQLDELLGLGNRQ